MQELKNRPNFRGFVVRRPNFRGPYKKMNEHKNRPNIRGPYKKEKTCHSAAAWRTIIKSFDIVQGRKYNRDILFTFLCDYLTQMTDMERKLKKLMKHESKMRVVTKLCQRYGEIAVKMWNKVKTSVELKANNMFNNVKNEMDIWRRDRRQYHVTEQMIITAAWVRFRSQIIKSIIEPYILSSKGDNIMKKEDIAAYMQSKARKIKEVLPPVTTTFDKVIPKEDITVYMQSKAIKIEEVLPPVTTTFEKVIPKEDIAAYMQSKARKIEEVLPPVTTTFEKVIPKEDNAENIQRKKAKYTDTVNEMISAYLYV